MGDLEDLDDFFDAFLTISRIASRGLVFSFSLLDDSRVFDLTFRNNNTINVNWKDIERLKLLRSVDFRGNQAILDPS